jgi:SAM-dependent methyltransferase
MAQAHRLHLEEGIDLDIGCGDGVVGAALTRRVGLGIDLEGRALAWSRRRGVYQSLAQASATALPLRPGCLRLILCNCVLEHIPNDQAALAEMARVLAQGGHLILTLAGEPLPRLVLGERADGPKQAALDRSLNHHHYYVLDSIADRLGKLGLTVVDSQVYVGPREARWWYRLRTWQNRRPVPTALMRRRLDQILLLPVTLGLLPAVLLPTHPDIGAGLAILAVKG